MNLPYCESIHRFHNDLFGICVFGKGLINSVTALSKNQRRMDVSTRRRCNSYVSQKRRFFNLFSQTRMYLFVVRCICYIILMTSGIIPPSFLRLICKVYYYFPLAFRQLYKLYSTTPGTRYVTDYKIRLVHHPPVPPRDGISGMHTFNSFRKHRLTICITGVCISTLWHIG